MSVTVLVYVVQLSNWSSGYQNPVTGQNGSSTTELVLISDFDCMFNNLFEQLTVMKPVKRGLGPNNENTLKNYLNSCQTFRLLKWLPIFPIVFNETVLKNISRLLIS